MRLFVALDLPPAVRGALASWAREAVGSDSRLRLVGEESLHATLVFLGERAADDVPRLAAILREAVAGAPSPPLAVAGALWLAPRRPHVLTAGLGDPSGGLARIHEAVLGALVREAGHEAERRRHRPHVTVARVRGRIRPFELPPPPGLAFHPPAVGLYRSHLGRGPARYEELSSVPLGTLS